MAVETSVKQMALTRDIGPGGFMERLQAMMVFVARAVLTEAGTTPQHGLRASYAQRVINTPVPTTSQAGPMVCMGVNVVQTTVYDENSKTASCTIADIDLQSQIQTLWNSLASIDTPS